MFKPRSKKKRAAIVTTSLHDEEDDEEEGIGDAIQSFAKKKKTKTSKKRSTLGSKGKQSVLSFQNNDNEEEDEDHSLPVMKSKKRKGMGFGGAVVEEVEDTNDEFKSFGVSMYGADALKELKASQKYTLPSTNDHDKVEDIDNMFTTQSITKNDDTSKTEENIEPRNIDELEQIATAASTLNHKTKSELGIDADFIPLGNDYNDGEQQILNGDRATEFNLISSERFQSIVDDEAIHDWESKLARRGMQTAAVLNDDPHIPKARQALHQGDMDNEMKEEIFNFNRQNESSESFEKISSAINTAVERIQDTQSELRSLMQRRQAELTHIESDKERFTSEVNQAESMSRWFHSTRNHLANWIGALRDLDSKLRKIENAILFAVKENLALSKMRQRQFEDDLQYMLNEKSLLKSSAGRTATKETTDTISVDEFGRNLSNRSNIERIDRYKRQMENIHRQRLFLALSESNDSVIEQAAQLYSSVDNEESSDDRDLLDQQKQTLSLALNAAVTDTNEEFLSLSKMLHFQQEWLDTYPEEYMKCNARSGFSNLLQILARFDLINRHEILWSLSGINEAMLDLEINYEKQFFNEIALDELFSYFKSIIQSGYNPQSEHQTIILTTMYKSLKENYLKSKDCESKLNILNDCILENLRTVVEDVSIQIPRFDHFNENTDLCWSSEKGHLLFFVLVQFHRMKKTVLNLIKYWVPLFSNMENPQIEKDFAQTILMEAVSIRLLPMLTSMRESPNATIVSMGKTMLSDLYLELRNSCLSWLQSPDLMLFTSPLRASLHAFDIKWLN